MFWLISFLLIYNSTRYQMNNWKNLSHHSQNIILHTHTFINLLNYEIWESLIMRNSLSFVIKHILIWNSISDTCSLIIIQVSNIHVSCISWSINHNYVTCFSPFLIHVGCLRQNFQFTIQRNISFSEIINNCSSWILIRQQLSNERCFIHVTHCTSLLMWEMETISFKWWIMDNFYKLYTHSCLTQLSLPHNTLYTHTKKIIATAPYLNTVTKEEFTHMTQFYSPPKKSIYLFKQ